MGVGGRTIKVGATASAGISTGLRLSGGVAGPNAAISMVCTTVSIQNVANISIVCAFWPGPLGFVMAASLPNKKGTLSALPPNSGAAGVVEIEMTVPPVMVNPSLCFRKTVFGSLRISWVMVPAETNGVRSCGMRVVVGSVTFCEGKLKVPDGSGGGAGATAANGVMSTGG